MIPLPPPQNTPQVTTSVASEPSLEDLVKKIAIHNLQFHKQMNSSIQNLETQIGQLATSKNAYQAQGSNQLPTQTIVNPKGPNVTAISLRSGNNVESLEPSPDKSKKVVEPMSGSEIVVEKEYTTNSFPIESSEN